MSRTRRALDDAINGDADDMDSATLRALRVIASSVDDIDTRLSTINLRIASVGLSVLATLIAAVVIYAIQSGAS